MLSSLKEIYGFTKGTRIKYLIYLFGTVMAALFSIAPPLVFKVVLDSVIGTKGFALPKFIVNIINQLGGRDYLLNNMWICLFVIVLFSLLDGFFTFFRGKYSAVAAEETCKKLKDALYMHIQNLPYDFHVKVQTGDLLQRASTDVDILKKFYAHHLKEFTRTLFTIIFTLSICFYFSVKLTLISMTLLPVIFFFAFIFFKRMHRVFMKADVKEGELSTCLQENLTGVRVVRAFGREQYETEKFEEKNLEFTQLLFKSTHNLALYWSLSNALCFFQIVAVLIAGVFFVYSNEISLGTFVVFNTYISRFVWPVRNLGRVLSETGKTTVSAARIVEILNIPEEDYNESDLKPDLSGDIVFDNVCFSYDDGRDILNNLSFTVKKGETVAILGKTGSGKSTLMNLLLRFYEYNGGSIKINGTELNTIDKKYLRKNIGLIMQEPFLYSKTIKSNIKMARPSATDTEIYEAASVSYIHDVIQRFDKKYETPVGERGVTLSGGQKQRLSMARTLIKNNPILIFDDSLSAVDTETDKQIRSALKESNRDSTVFIISHRITTLSEADRIFIFENGTITASGTHEELLQTDGMYKKIWEIQA